jgi:hypothetical protein
MNRCESYNIVLPSLCGNCQAKASARHKCDWITSKKTGTFCKWCGITKPENACAVKSSYRKYEGGDCYSYNIVCACGKTLGGWTRDKANGEYGKHLVETKPENARRKVKR